MVGQGIWVVSRIGWGCKTTDTQSDVCWDEKKTSIIDAQKFDVYVTFEINLHNN